MTDYFQLVSADAPAPFKPVRSEHLLKTWCFNVTRFVFNFEGNEFHRDVEVHKGVAAVVALNDDMEMAFIRQYRVPLKQWTLELPGGQMDLGEDVEASALRELNEETGLTAPSLTELTRFAASPGHSTQMTAIFLAENCTEGAPIPMGIEEMSATVHMIPIPDAVQMVSDGLIIDSKTIIGILYAEKIWNERKEHELAQYDN